MRNEYNIKQDKVRAQHLEALKQQVDLMLKIEDRPEALYSSIRNNLTRATKALEAAINDYLSPN